MKPTPYVQLVKELLTDTDLYSTLDYDNLERLPGGVVSLVLATMTKIPIKEDFPCNIVIKHTFEQKKDAPLSDNFGYRDWFSLLEPAPRTHHLDYEILHLLQNPNGLRVPTVLRYYKEKRTTVMVDFRAQGYCLMQDMLVEGDLPLESARQMGKSLSSLVQIFQQIHDLVTPVEDRTLQVRERLDELHMFLRPQLSLYREIEQHLLSGTYLIPTDTHPKNTGVNERGEVILFDFGRSIVAHDEYPAPNFAAHIALGAIGGCFEDPQYGIDYIMAFINAYNETSPRKNRIHELWFVRYFAAELLHRGLSGRWLDNRLFENSSLQEVERAVHDVGIAVFRPTKGSQVKTIEELLSIVLKISQAVKQGKYKD